jgi:hypothetical protein
MGARIVLGIAVLLATGVARASDHGDLMASPKADLTDVHAFVVDARPPVAHGREGDLVIAISTNPSVPVTATGYTFPADVVFEIHIDPAAQVIDDPSAVTDVGFFGGTIVAPELIEEGITIRVRFDAGAPVVEYSAGGEAREIQDHPRVELFHGLADDPFIRTRNAGRNVGAIVLQLPLAWVLRGQPTILLWVTAKIDGSAALHDELYGRPSGGAGLNRLHPRDHLSVTGQRPNVLIYDTSLPAAFPNGRALEDDVIDLTCLYDLDGDGVREAPIGTCRQLEMDVPAASANDVEFPGAWPYLAPPHAPK